VTKEYRPWTPEQTYLLPPSPMQWLPEGHLAYFVLDLVRELDVSGIEHAIQSKDGRGTRPYSPRMMTALLLYAYCVGVFSSRKVERATYEDVAFRVLAGGEHPHFTTVNLFRLEHREALSGLFVQVLRLCARAGLSTVGHVSLDGSKVQANASKHKAMSYGRMKEEEKRLAAEIEALLFRADETDHREDEQYGQGQRADELPEELHRRDVRLRRIREAKAALEKEAAEARAAQLRDLATGQREKAEGAADATERKRATTRAANSQKRADELSSRHDDDDDGTGGSSAGTSLPTHRVPTTSTGDPTDKAQRNFTDPDSRIMVRNGVFVQAYNAQVAVSESQVIVAHAVTNQPPDQEHLVPMMERLRGNCGDLPEIVSADAGYLSERNIAYCDANGVDAYVAVGRKTPDGAELGRLPMTRAQEVRWQMHQKLTTAQGRATYSRRKVIVEPVFGQIKQALGFRRFSLRGLGKVAAEWGLVCLCHNLLKLYRALGPLRPATHGDAVPQRREPPRRCNGP
jgi:transposase